MEEDYVVSHFFKKNSSDPDFICSEFFNSEVIEQFSKIEVEDIFPSKYDAALCTLVSEIEHQQTTVSQTGRGQKRKSPDDDEKTRKSHMEAVSGPSSSENAASDISEIEHQQTTVSQTGRGQKRKSPDDDEEIRKSHMEAVPGPSSSENVASDMIKCDVCDVMTRMQSLRTMHNSTISETFRYMVQREGLLRPIRGMSAVVAGAGPAHACFFATYEQSKHTLGHLTRHRHDHLTHGLSGCLASLVHDAVSNPAEVVKQRMQMLNSPYRGAWDCAKRIYRAEGLRAFYRSYSTQVAMNVPFQAVHFVTYEWVTSLVNPSRSYDPRAHALAGGMAGALAAAATTPLDVCKTVLNTQEGAGRTERLAEAAGAVLRGAGPAGFFRGLRARVIYQVPAAAICWLTYETLKHMLRTVELTEDTTPTTATAIATANTGGVGSVGSVGGVGPPLACAALRLAAASTDPART